MKQPFSFCQNERRMKQNNRVWFVIIAAHFLTLSFKAACPILSNVMVGLTSPRCVALRLLVWRG